MKLIQIISFDCGFDGKETQFPECLSVTLSLGKFAIYKWKTCLLFNRKPGTFFMRANATNVLIIFVEGKDLRKDQKMCVQHTHHMNEALRKVILRHFSQT